MGVEISFTLCWFFLINKEMSKGVTLTFDSIQQLFIRNFRVTFSIFKLLQSPDNGKNSYKVFQIFGFLINPLKTKFVRTPELVLMLT